jgi:hypothetical protein
MPKSAPATLLLARVAPRATDVSGLPAIAVATLARRPAPLPPPDTQGSAAPYRTWGWLAARYVSGVAVEITQCPSRGSTTHCWSAPMTSSPEGKGLVTALRAAC